MPTAALSSQHCPLTLLATLEPRMVCLSSLSGHTSTTIYLIALVFGAIALLTGLLALVSRLGGYISSMTTFVALFFQMLAATLMT
jgi:hypothetical protein